LILHRKIAVAQLLVGTSVPTTSSPDTSRQRQQFQMQKVDSLFGDGSVEGPDRNHAFVNCQPTSRHNHPTLAERLRNRPPFSQQSFPSATLLLGFKQQLDTPVHS
jgi:hypothetical protein